MPLKVSFALIACVGFWAAARLAEIGSLAFIAPVLGVAALLVWSTGFPDDAGFGTDTAMLTLLAVLSAHAMVADELTLATLLGVTVAVSFICVRRWAHHHVGSRALIRLNTGVGMTGVAIWMADATNLVDAALIAALVWIPAVVLTVGFVARTQFFGRLTGKAQGSQSGPAHLSAR